MADYEVKTIYKLETGEAINTLAGLRTEIKDTKGALDGLEIGSEEYNKTLGHLTETQEAQRRALEASGKQAGFAKGSYYQLNAQLVQARREWKNLSEEERNNAAVGGALRAQIESLDAQLKAMDKGIGQYQRNVGDYFGEAKGKVDAFGKGLKLAGGNTEKLTGAMEGLSKNPAVAVLGIVVAGMTKLAGQLKETEEGSEALNVIGQVGAKIGAALGKVVDKIAQGLGKVLDWLKENDEAVVGFASKAVSGFTAVGNALLQYLLTPIRTVIEAAKGVGKIFGDIFRGDWSSIKDDAKAAGEGIRDAWVKGFSFKDNFETGKAAGLEFVSRLASQEVKDKAKEAGSEIGREVGTEAAQVAADTFWAEFKARLAEEKEIEALDAEMTAMAEDMFAGMAHASDEATRQIIEDEQRRLLALEEEERAAARLQATYQASLTAVKSVLDGLADALEQNADGSRKNAEAVKKLRIASATIDTLSGATAAVTNAIAQLGYPAGPIVGAIQAAAITATGLANIAKMKAVSTSGGSSAAAAAPATYSAPNIDAALPQQGTSTGRTGEYAVGEAQDTRVVLVETEVEASLARSRGRVSETSW